MILESEDSYGYEVSQTIKLSYLISRNLPYIPILKKLEKIVVNDLLTKNIRSKTEYYSLTQRDESS